MRPIVFLHIPKTAGQTVHNALVGIVGRRRVSPIRTHTEAEGPDQFPPGYALYSGHLDWTDLDGVAGDPFVFSVLRDPRERVASFYLYLTAEAGKLSPAELALPENTGKRVIRELSADDYFFGGNAEWQRFVRDHYDNFYCSYFATRRMRGRSLLEGLDDEIVIARALEGAGLLNAVYPMGGLSRLEADIEAVTGKRPAIAGRRDNAGPVRTATRWEALAEQFERADSSARLEAFVDRDQAFLRRLGPEFA